MHHPHCTHTSPACWSAGTNRAQNAARRPSQTAPNERAYPAAEHPDTDVAPHTASLPPCHRRSAPASESWQCGFPRSPDPLSEAHSLLSPCRAPDPPSRPHGLYCHRQSNGAHAVWHPSRGYWQGTCCLSPHPCWHLSQDRLYPLSPP